MAAAEPSRARVTYCPQFDAPAADGLDSSGRAGAPGVVAFTTATKQGLAAASTAVGADLTLATQLSLERLEMLLHLAQAWSGPVVAIVYVSCDIAPSASDCTVQHQWQSAYLVKKVNEALEVAAHPEAWTVHYFFETRNGALYPINRLRNQARAATATDWVLVLDADFVPGPTLASDFSAALEGMDRDVLQEPLFAFVVPAFEAQAADRGSSPTLQTKADVLAACRAGTVVPFRLGETPRSHGATDYTRWQDALRPYLVER
jgi:hypothetical protein